MIRKLAAHFGIVLLLLAGPGGRAKAQEKSATPPLTAEQVVERLTRMNSERAEALHDYTTMQVYHLELSGMIHKSADMVAKMTYHWPDQKEFNIVSESGSDIMRARVLKAILAAEKESMLKENRDRSAFNQENYEIRLQGVEGSPEPRTYILDATPRTKNKFLFKGKVWVDAKDFAVTRIECEPAKNPSWWTKKNDITRVYQKLGDFWLPAHTQSITEVRIFGHTVLEIEYKDYHLLDAGKLPAVARSEQAPPPKTAP
jgi:outer membrane lipoprotein-sorting protein